MTIEVIIDDGQWEMDNYGEFSAEHENFSTDYFVKLI